MAIKKYKVREGFVVHLSERESRHGGEVLELEDDVAELHIHKLEAFSAKQAAAEAAAAEAAAAEAAAAEAAAAEAANSNKRGKT